MAVILCWWPTYTLPTSELNKSSLEALMQKELSAMASNILPQDNVSVSFLDYGGVALQELIIWDGSRVPRSLRFFEL